MDCTIVSPPEHGALTYNYPDQAPTNSRYLVYTATNGYTGTDTFTFKANDGTNDSPVATATITVKTNTAPRARRIIADVASGCAMEIALNVSDAHTEVSHLECIIVEPPEYGMIEYADTTNYPVNSHVLYYTATNAYTGQDTFTYTVCDGDLTSTMATCMVTVVSNTAPVAYNSSANATPDLPCGVWLSGGDDHTDWDQLHYKVATPPTNGTIVYRYPNNVPSNSMEMLYTPTNGFVKDSFTFTVNDGVLTSDTAVCSIEIQTNTAPNVSSTYMTLSMDDTYKDFTINVWDDYTEQEDLTLTLASQPSNGIITHQYPYTYPTNSMQVTFTMTNATPGTNVFTYTVSDGFLSSVPATGRIIVVENTAPTASGTSYTIVNNEPYDMYLSVSDSQTSYQDLECVIISPPSHGTLVYSYPESYPYYSRRVIYTATPGYTGSDSFTYKASDGTLESATASVSITVEGNTPPSASDMSETTVELVETSINLDVSDQHTSKSDIECLIVDPPDHGTLVYIYQNDYPRYSYYVTYAAERGYSGMDSFTFMAFDGALTSEVATCSITVEENTAPTANDITVETVYDIPVDITLDVSDEHSSSSYLECLVDQPEHGEVTYRYPDNYPDQSRYLTYTPTNNFIGNDTFTFRATDGALTSETAVCTVTLASNTPPVAYNIRGVTSPDTPLDLQAIYDEVNSGQTPSALVASNAINGDVTVSGTTLTYTPNPGYSGLDQFAYKINDGYNDSNIALARLQVRSADDPADSMVILVVNDTLLPEISNRVSRLKTDLENEGYTSKIKPWSLTGLSNATNLWAYLRSEYDDPDQYLQGAILIGNIPKARTYSYHPYYSSYNWYYTDLIYWNMKWFQQSDPIETYDIWVSRINAEDTNWGAEDVLIKRALDANHDYRTGKSRLPHTAFVFDCFNENPSSSTILDVWPEVRAGGGGNHNATYKFLPDRTDLPYAACDAFAAGGDLFHETSHGNASGYMEGSWFNESALYRIIAQQRFGLIGSCTSGAFGGIANNHIFTRGGGLVFAVGGTAINYSSDFSLNSSSSYSGHPDCRARLAAGDSWGGACLYSYPWENYYTGNRIVFYGDMSIGAMASPSNAMPVIENLTVSKSAPIVGEPVSFSISVTDPDAAATNSPYVDYEHQVEWFMTGYNSGRNNPTYLTNNTQTASWTNITHAFASAGSYTVRAEVTDEWQARVWKERTINVNTLPIASNDTATCEAGHSVSIAVLDNDVDPDSHTLSLDAIATAPEHGTAEISGDEVIYTASNTWEGLDSLVYQIEDSMGGTHTAAVHVTVFSDVTAPRLEQAWSEGEPNTAYAIFSEAVKPGKDSGGAENPASYTLNYDAGVTGVTIHADGKTVTLNVTNLLPGLQYVLTVSNVLDRAFTPNAMPYPMQAAFSHDLKLTSVADSYVRGGDYANMNYGGDTTAWLKLDNSGDYTRETCLRFNLEGLPDGARNVKLRLMVDSGGEGIDQLNIEVRSVADDSWNENTVTWNNRPAQGSAITNIAGSRLTVGEYVELDLTAEVKAEADGLLSLALVAVNSPDSDRWAQFGTREQADPMSRPELIVRMIDGDADGLCDNWENYFFEGTNTIDGTIDSDNDGMSDADEWHAGTDPLQAGSALAFDSVMEDDSNYGFVIRWQSVAGKQYSVMSATNLMTGFNITVATNLTATPPQNIYTDTVERTQNTFYSIELENE